MIQWTGKAFIEDMEIDLSNFDFSKITTTTTIRLVPAQRTTSPVQTDNHVKAVNTTGEIKITVKPYMTKESTPEFDFMEKWNNNRPMPMRTMVGTVEKETKGMVYMHLHGYAQQTITCACCGKELTNPVSRLYGIGPVCLAKIGITRNIEDVENIKEELVKVEWTGWVIKSAITEQEEI